MDVWNRHRESENTKFTKLVQVRNFITFELNVFRQEERESQSLYADIVSSQPNQRAAPVAHKVVWPGPGLNLDLPVWTQELNSLLFLKSPYPQPTLLGMTSFTSLVPIPIWDFYFDICEWRILPVRAWTPVLMLYLTNPCAKRKVLSLTKLRGKIYKTKSLRHYITETESMGFGHSQFFTSVIIRPTQKLSLSRDKSII